MFGANLFYDQRPSGKIIQERSIGLEAKAGILELIQILMHI